MANPVLYAIHKEFERLHSRNGDGRFRTAIERLHAVMAQAARRDTATPHLQEAWSPLRPLLGHDWLSALVVQDLFAGDLGLVALATPEGGQDVRLAVATTLGKTHPAPVTVLEGTVVDAPMLPERMDREAALANKANAKSRLRERYERFAGECHVIMAMLTFEMR